MRYESILIDCHSTANGLKRARTRGAAVVELHRILALLAGRYLAGGGPGIAIYGSGDGLRRDVADTAQHLGLPLVTGRLQDQLLLALVSDHAKRGTSCLIVSDDLGAAAHLADTPVPIHWLEGVTDTQRLWTLAGFMRQGHGRPFAQSDGNGRGTIIITRPRADLQAHRWWLASCGAEAALMPDCWRRIERLARD